ncbi:hypothetical protein A0H81_02739 [Grifola frondosa]|uniref:Uncharacterized protein n=1 Tax=Grifola frondosa TaxID=5627 RepID=A0A1C7MTF3_GRIFR|nr:hypothetical protein A0H81_02739 [Grifola frondosa]
MVSCSLGQPAIAIDLAGVIDSPLRLDVLSEGSSISNPTTSECTNPSFPDHVPPYGSMNGMLSCDEDGTILVAAPL